MVSKNRPFFSVVIPLYNKESYVQKTIKSVLEQSFQDFEIVIVDDGSTDSSVNIIQTINDSRIRIIKQKNAGVSVARNTGIKEANADYIAFLDSDDVWLPELLFTIFNLILKYKNVGLYATAYKMSSNGSFRKLNIQGLPKKDFDGIIPNYFKSVVLGDFLVWSSAVCIPKKIFEENDIWFPAGEKYGEDQYVWGRIAMQFEMAYSTNVCAIYNLGTIGNTQDPIKNEAKPHDIILSLDGHKYLMKDKNQIFYFEKYLKKHIAEFVLLNILQCRKKTAIKQLMEFRMFNFYTLKLLPLFVLPCNTYKLLKKINKIIRMLS
jgi:glycosyltransferase involved in cell wall biosynthesis